MRVQNHRRTLGLRPRGRRRQPVGFERCEDRLLLAATLAYSLPINSDVPVQVFTSLAAGNFDQQAAADGFAAGDKDGLLSVYDPTAAGGQGQYKQTFRQIVGTFGEAVTALASGAFDNAANEPNHIGLAVLKDQSLTILLGDGTAKQFAPPAGQATIDLSSSLTPGANAIAIASGRFFGTTAVDLAVLDSKGKILLFEGDGKGDFSQQASPAPLDSTKTYVGLVAGAFGTDQTTISLVAVDSSGGLTTLDNNGSGTFTAEPTQTLSIGGPIVVNAATPVYLNVSEGLAPFSDLDQFYVVTGTRTLYNVNRDDSGHFVSGGGFLNFPPQTAAIASAGNGQNDVFGAQPGINGMTAGIYLPYSPSYGGGSAVAYAEVGETAGGAGMFGTSKNADVVIGYSGGTIRVGKGDGTGHYTYDTPSVFVDGQPAAIKVGRFDGDNVDDVAVIDSTGTLSIFLGDGNDGLKTGVKLPISDSTQPLVDLVLGDFDNDGKTDIAVLDEIGVIHLFGGDGNGGFTPFANVIRPPSISTSSNESVIATGITAGNFSASGTGLAVSFKNNMVEVYTNLQAASPTRLFESIQGAGGSIVAGKFDGSGTVYDDLVVTVTPYDPRYGYTTPQIVEFGNSNDGTGQFSTSAVTNLKGSYSGYGTLVAGDFDDDGKTDLAFPSIMLGNGDGTFLPAVSLGTNGSFVAANVNGETDTNIDFISFGSDSIDSSLATTTPAKLLPIADVSAVEGDPYYQTAPEFLPLISFSAKLDKIPLRGSIVFKTVDQSAKSGIDYYGINQSYALTSDTLNIPISVKVDYITESPRRVFQLMAVSAVGIDISGMTANASGTILDDDSTVVNSAVDGVSTGDTVTLRRAILVANATNADPTYRNPNGETISFNLPSSSAYYINLNTELPAITGPTHIDGRTQPTAAGVGFVRVGLMAYYGINDLTLAPGSEGSSISGLVIQGFGKNQILINNGTGSNSNAPATRIDDDVFFGYGYLPTLELLSLVGVYVQNSANVIIGTPGSGLPTSNVFSNLNTGIWIDNGSTGTRVLNSTIHAVNNGIVIAAASGNTIGEAKPATGSDANDIVAIEGAGISIEGGSSNNVVLGNAIHDSTFGIQLIGSTGNSIGYLQNAGMQAELTLGNRITNNTDIGIVLENGSNGNYINGNNVYRNGNADITINGSNDNQFFGNSIGTTTNNDSQGLILRGGASGNTIGYPALPDGRSRSNIVLNIAGNGIWLLEGASGNRVFADTIRGASTGIHLNAANGNTIGQFGGGDTPGTGFGNVITASTNIGIALEAGSNTNYIDRNRISGNANANLTIDHSSANQVFGNWIGTDATGQNADPNPQANGVVLRGQAAENRIGEATDTPGTGFGNVILGHRNDGLLIIEQATANLIAGNVISANGNGIEIRNAGRNVIGPNRTRYRNITSGNRN